MLAAADAGRTTDAGADRCWPHDDAGVVAEADVTTEADAPPGADERDRHSDDLNEWPAGPPADQSVTVASQVATLASQADAPASGQAADAPGPLALAASAAREAAEARIRAALHQTRRSGLEPPYPLENPYPSETFDVTDLPAAAGAGGPAGVYGATASQGPVPRPEVASGAQPWPAPDRPAPDRRDARTPQQDDIASSWGGPEFGAADDEQQPVVPFRPRADLAAYLDEGPEPDPAYDERPDHASSGYAKRNRISRGYSIPRLSRSKRPGAVPGA